MNIPALSSSIILGVVCAISVAVATDAPKSIQGATIKIGKDISYSPAEISITHYEAQGNTAKIVLNYEWYQGRNSTGLVISGAKTQEQAYNDPVPPATVTITEKKGNTYYGTISGSVSASHFNYGEESHSFNSLNKETIQFIFPDNGRPNVSTVQGPDRLPKGTILQIKTEKNTFTGEIGSTGKNIEVNRYTPNKQQTKIELSLGYELEQSLKGTDKSGYFIFSGTENPEEANAADAPKPYIVFTEKVSNKIYKGNLFGYLYRINDNDKVISQEKLLTITIILP